jgi:hypothetical protein
LKQRGYGFGTIRGFIVLYPIQHNKSPPIFMGWASSGISVLMNCNEKTEQEISNFRCRRNASPTIVKIPGKNQASDAGFFRRLKQELGRNRERR